uniref:Ribosomal protein S3 n=1 Tax=Gredgaria maugeana TaxID=2007213 RepID=UPI0022FD6BFC|nr:Ribosomal protein S3 [Gredgaria maugeana]WAX04202.1 Ribosomal protein S3 [Gredgaria maugeana]
MSKKINLTGKSLALTSVWTNKSQYYGNFSFKYSKYIHFIFLLNVVFTRQLNFNLLYYITQIQYFFFVNQLRIILSSSFLNKNFVYFLKFIYLFWILNFKNFYSFHLQIYLEKTLYFSVEFLKNYIFFLIKKKIKSPKKIFNLLILLLKKNFNKPIVSISKNGLTDNNILIGFKIQLSGRYESAKSTMANQIFLKFGKITSTNLSFTVKYFSHFFYTKSGISTLKIWLFYNSKSKKCKKNF